MPPYKNQRYVPQSYLRGWATDSTVPLYHIEQGREILRNTSLISVTVVFQQHGDLSRASAEPP